MLHFDQRKGEVFGDELITLRPFGENFKQLYLNSSELIIDFVTLENSQQAPLKLRYVAQDPRLSVTLDRASDRTRVLNVRIRTTDSPAPACCFVNPTPHYPRRPEEVFSQGDPDLNHFWFPCWDHPNDMATSETVSTVPVGQTVVSNGKLVSVTRSGNQIFPQLEYQSRRACVFGGKIDS